MGVHLSDDNRTIEHEERRTTGRRESDYLIASANTSTLALMAHLISIELIVNGPDTDADKLEQIGKEVEIIKLLEKPTPGIRTVEVYDQAGNRRTIQKCGTHTI